MKIQVFIQLLTWPAMNRGYYFSSASYLSSLPIVLGYNLTFEFWIKAKSYGHIFYKSKLRIIVELETTLFVNGIVTIKFKEINLNLWSSV